MANPVSALPDGICNYCRRGHHNLCNDPRPGEQCPCLCPLPVAMKKRDEITRLKKRLQYLRRQVIETETRLQEKMDGTEDLYAPDGLDIYRRPGDREYGRFRLAEATAEAFPE